MIDGSDLAHQSAASLRPQLLGSRHAVLRPITFDDYDLIRAAELTADLGPTWRHHGSTPSPEVFVQRLWSGVLAQFIVDHRGRPTGIVTAYAADFQNGHAYISVARFRKDGSALAFGSGLVLFVNYLFECWEFRKIYAEVAEYNLLQFPSLVERWMEPEGRLRDHVYLFNRYWDMATFSLGRSTWHSRVRPLAQHLLDVPYDG